MWSLMPQVKPAISTTRPISTTVRSGPTNPSVDALLARPESAWITRDLEQKALAHAIAEPSFRNT